jgi:hypothetical protein
MNIIILEVQDILGLVEERCIKGERARERVRDSERERETECVRERN